MDCTSSRQRINVPEPMPTSRATTSTGALSGGSNRATALPLNFSEYLAISILFAAPGSRFKEATTILTQGALQWVAYTPLPAFLMPDSISIHHD
jgi:undecaprenyl pyrophosphate phosphatase UppP